MKKRVLVLAMAATLCFGSTISVSAAVPCGNRCNRSNYVDANKDGICDHFVDKNGDGIHDYNNCPVNRKKNRKVVQNNRNRCGGGHRNHCGAGRNR